MISSDSQEADRAAGVLIAESLRPGSALTDLGMVLDKITRSDPAKPAPGQPSTWTLIDFNIAAGHAGILAESIATALDTGPWYVEFHTRTDTFVVFRHRTFRFPRGDDEGHTAAIAYGRSLGIPDHQLDWTR